MDIELDQTYNVRFCVNCPHTSYGQHVAVIGSSAALGKWMLHDALPLATDEHNFPMWGNDAPVRLLPGTEFKIIMINSHNGHAVWEDLCGQNPWENRNLPGGLPYDITVCATWSYADMEIKSSIANPQKELKMDLGKLWAIFDRCDRDGDGRINRRELIKVDEAIAPSSARSTGSSTRSTDSSTGRQPTIIALDSNDLDDANEAYFPMLGPVQDPPVMADLEASPKFAPLHQETQGDYAQPLVEDRNSGAKKLPIWFEKNWRRWALRIQCCSV